MAPSSQEFGVFFASIRGGSAEFGLDKQMSESNNEGIRGAVAGHGIRDGLESNHASTCRERGLSGDPRSHGVSKADQIKAASKVIGFLGALDRLYGVSVTTRNWNTIAAIARVLRNDPSD